MYMSAGKAGTKCGARGGITEAKNRSSPKVVRVRWRGGGKKNFAEPLKDRIHGRFGEK